MHEYGKANWESLWETLEQQGNVGLDHVINPALYPRLLRFLAQNPKAITVDFGCGTNFMGIQLLFGYRPSVPALKDVADADQARFNALLYVGIEGSQELVNQSQRYLTDIGGPRSIGTINAHIGSDLPELFDPKSIDLCVSRNFLMHLSSEDTKSHFSYVASMLKPEGRYIFAALNPSYELSKAGKDLSEGERYEFAHGKEGEYGAFYHYFKSDEQFKSMIEADFVIEEKVPCLPISNEYRESHGRYYDAENPMAHVFTLKLRG